MKIIYNSIQFELTRRCNQECKHCLRGKSQDVDISKEVIDAFFDNNDIYEITNLFFSGGEPTLNGEMLEYIVDKIIEKNIIVLHFVLSINGLSYSEDLVNGLKKLNDYCRKISPYKRKYSRYGTLFISQSQYHKPACESVMKKLDDLPFFIRPVGIDYIESDNLLPYGNAYENHLTKNKPDIKYVTNYEETVKEKEYEGEKYLVIDCCYISSNGNVLKDGCISYEMMDEYMIGNVLDKTIEQMYTQDIKTLKFAM